MNPINNKSCTRGSALSETLILLLFFVAVVFAGFNTISVCIARMWLEHSLYSALQCELASGSNCRKIFSNKARLIAWGQLQSLQLETRLVAKNYKTGMGQVIWCNTQQRSLCETKNKLILKMQLNEKEMAAMRSWGS